MVNKHQAMFNYIKEYVPFYLTFNTIIENIGQTAIQPVYSDTIVKKYFGGAMKEYIFAIVQIRQYDTGITDPPINASEMFDVEKFMDWIAENQRIANYPDFGENCKIQRIENLQNMPNLAATNEQGNAKYMLQCKITYCQLPTT